MLAIGSRQQLDCLSPIERESNVSNSGLKALLQPGIHSGLKALLRVKGVVQNDADKNNESDDVIVLESSEATGRLPVPR